MDRFVARQPIFDATRSVHAYELLFRTGLQNAFPVGFSPETASLITLRDALHTFGLDQLCGGKPAYINVTRGVLLGGLFHLLPPEKAVCEVLETVEPDAEVVEACRALKAKGFVIALDDFVLRPGWEPLLKLADVVKVDFRATPPAERVVLKAALASYDVELLAEKVETEAEFRESVAAGYAYVQGYFFARPEILVGKELPAGQTTRLELLREVSQPSLDLRKVEAVLRRDVALSVNLLHYLNSARFGWRSQVQSLKQALVLLGEVPFRRWVQVAAVGALATPRDAELLQTCLFRARLGELLAPKAGLPQRELDLFWCGLISGLEALTGQTLAILFTALGVPPDLQRAVRGDADGSSLGRVVALVRGYEAADWPGVEQHCLALEMSPDALPGLVAEAAEWARTALAASA